MVGQISVGVDMAEKVEASMPAKVEHPFLDVKQIFGYAQESAPLQKGVRYPGLAKNRERLALLLGSPP